MNRILIHQGCSQIYEVFHPFKGFYYLYICCDFSLHAGLGDMTIYLVFLSFNSKPISLLMNIEASVFSFIVSMLAPNTLGLL